MKKVKTPTPTPFDSTKTGKEGAKKSKRKNTTESTRNTGRQRSGSNDPQQGSH